MQMKRSASTIWFRAAGVQFLLMWLGFALFVWKLGSLEPELSGVGVVLVLLTGLLCLGAIVSVLIGLGLRLFARTTTTNASAAEAEESVSVESSATSPVGLEAEKEFNFWHKALIAGIVWWFLYPLGIPLSNSELKGFDLYVLLGTWLPALPIAIVCMNAAGKRRATNPTQSVVLLKVPFFYLLGLIVILIIASIVERFLR